MRKLTWLFYPFIICILLITIPGYALPSPTLPNTNERSVVIILADKMDSVELFDSKLPAIQDLLKKSACGLMNIRSDNGYTNTEGGYLTLGAGSRATAVGLQGGTAEETQPLIGGKASAYLYWSMGRSLPDSDKRNPYLLVPEIALMLNQARLEDHPVIPGRLGNIFHQQGWKTCLIGNNDGPAVKSRPGGLLLTDSRGIIDEGVIDASLNEIDPNFPYLYRTNISKATAELRSRLAPRKIIAVEFSDFAKLELYREEMNPDRYKQLKQLTWNRFSAFLKQIIQMGPPQNFSLIITSPSVSREGYTKKNLLAPLVIYSPLYPAGLLTSGTTKWFGLVANIDFLPTITNIVQFNSVTNFQGKIMQVIPSRHCTDQLLSLNQRLITANFWQRSLLDWFIGLISVFWIIGMISFFTKQSRIGDWLVTAISGIPLVMILLPLTPTLFWGLPGFLLATALIAFIFVQINNVEWRFLTLSAVIWLILVLDQLSGWNLIRFSALGYSAMAGSRYYGLGNEFLGVFLAASLLFSYLIYRKTAQKWPSALILGFSIFILSWPQFGAKFGGIVAGSIGFIYYLIMLYQWKLHHRRLWLLLFGCGAVLFGIALWDSLRPPEIQTHIGRFLHLLLSKDYLQVGQIIIRKLAMNLKLTVFSPWVRIILLAFVIGLIYKILTAKQMVLREDSLVWRAIFVCGFTAYIFNDAGVLAFAICLAYGFSYILLKKRTDSNGFILVHKQQSLNKSGDYNKL